MQRRVDGVVFEKERCSISLKGWLSGGGGGRSSRGGLGGSEGFAAVVFERSSLWGGGFSIFENCNLLALVRCLNAFGFSCRAR